MAPNSQKKTPRIRPSKARSVLSAAAWRTTPTLFFCRRGLAHHPVIHFTPGGTAPGRGKALPTKVHGVHANVQNGVTHLIFLSRRLLGWLLRRRRSVRGRSLAWLVRAGCSTACSSSRTGRGAPAWGGDTQTRKTGTAGFFQQTILNTQLNREKKIFPLLCRVYQRFFSHGAFP